MSLLLTRHVDQYRIDVRHPVQRCFGPDRLGTGRGQPLADQLTVKTIMLHDQYALHGRLRQ
jgi:hypothetical protein